MKKILIDTNIYSNAFRGEKTSVSILQRHEYILMSPIVVGELLAGFKRGNREENNKMQLKDFLVQERVKEIPITSETADIFAFILNNLRKQGTPVPANDIWIAAQTMENGAALATNDRHFEAIKGLILLRS